jgi:hypothetical protein
MSTCSLAFRYNSAVRLFPRLASLCVLTHSLLAQSPEVPPRWVIAPDGGITWSVKPGDVHQDQIEMSGRKVSLIFTYATTADGHLDLTRHVVFPSLRTIPNDTFASLSYTFGPSVTPRFFLNGKQIAAESVTSIHLRGLMTVESRIDKNTGVALTRTIFPSPAKPLVLERYAFTNASSKSVSVEMENMEMTIRTDPKRGVSGEYVITAKTVNPGPRQIAPGQTASFALVFTARESLAEPLSVNPDEEERARRGRVESILDSLQLKTPDSTLNTLFAFAKIRTTESIFGAKGGLMHGPGGGAYYAAIWANDQAEYAGPFFPFLGDKTGNEAALNAYRLFAKYMNPEYRPIPSSIIAEGLDEWHGAGDRGDMAMIAYGASRFALALGERKTAEELWPLIEWCLEYCRRKLNTGGVVSSDSDELEGRFPAGKANLNTSSLYYDALISASYLAKDLKKPAAEAESYQSQANSVRGAIERYFGASVEGFETYRYYDGNKVLRAWICTPLTMGVTDRSKGTVDALFSPRLWTKDGLATQAGEVTFWDRSTLYALRGVMVAGEVDRALPYLTYYSSRRLLGEHVPYPVEAYPEGNQRHLAAESALYCRIFIEGLFGIRPAGLKSFTMSIQLPKTWNHMSLDRIHAFGRIFSVSVENESVKVIPEDGGKAPRLVRSPPGLSYLVTFDD